MSLAGAELFLEEIPGIPSYVGTHGIDDQIVGVGPDGAALINGALVLYRYRQDLAHLSVEPTAQYVIRGPRDTSLVSYMDIKDKLAALAESPESDELGKIRPSLTAMEDAGRIAYKMTESAATVPSAEDISTDRDGAIRIVWELGSRTLELVCPSPETTQNPYLFYSDGHQYRVANDTSALRLGRLLSWLNGDIDTFPA